MKSILLFTIVISILSCGSHCEEISGKYTVLSQYYSATYSIGEVDGELKCSVLTYDDGTSKYDNREKSPYYIASKLKCVDGIYVDGISGATTILENNSMRIEKFSEDTLKVTTYIMRKPLLENWVKIKN